MDFEVEFGRLIKYHGKDRDVVIPKNVRVIETGAFEGAGIDSVVIPNSVVCIEKKAFSYKNITSIDIPDSVTMIEEQAFYRCHDLASVTMSRNVTFIGNMAFCECVELTSIVIPESVRFIGYGAFSDCPKLTVICYEGSVAHDYCVKKHLTYIFDYQYQAFRGLLPQGIEMLSSPFQADEKKPFIFISYSHRDRDSVLGILKTLYESGWKIWYDEGLTIGDRYDETLEAHVRNCSAFLLFITENSLNSYYIKENEIPWAKKYGKPIIKCALDKDIDYEIEQDFILASVSSTEIEPALVKVDGLAKGSRREAKGISVAVDPTARGGSSGNGFAYCLYSEKDTAGAKAIILEARNSGCTIYDAINEGENASKLKRCASLLVFLDKAFLEDKHLTNILIREFRAGRDIAVCQLENIEDKDLPDALIELHKLQWLNFTRGITADMSTKLAQHLQKRGCRNTSVLPGLKYEKTPEGIVITRYTGMAPEPRIESEYGGTPVVEIAENAFKNCIRVKSIVIPNSVKVIGNSAFKGCSGLTSIVIPDSVTSIGKDAFYGCLSLTSVTIPGSVGTISDRLFWECKSLKSAVIGEGISKISDYVFYRCESLTSVSLPETMTVIGAAAFGFCTNLVSINIPDSITVIDGMAFSSCESLTSFTIPKGVTQLSEGLFWGCSSLTSVTVTGSINTIGDRVFNDCKNLTVNCSRFSKVYKYCKKSGVRVKASLFGA